VQNVCVFSRRAEIEQNVQNYRYLINLLNLMLISIYYASTNYIIKSPYIITFVFQILDEVKNQQFILSLNREDYMKINITR